MINRRKLLQLGAAFGAAPLSGVLATTKSSLARASAAPPESIQPEPRQRLYKVILDRRFEDARAFGREIARLGSAALLHSFDGDLTDVWYRDLHPRWRLGATAIVGLTDYGAIFCLERLAWDFGMRTVFRCDHEVGADMDWSRHAAQLLALRPNLPAIAPLGPPPARTSGRPSLVSWAIAPVQRA